MEQLTLRLRRRGGERAMLHAERALSSAGAPGMDFFPSVAAEQHQAPFLLLITSVTEPYQPSRPPQPPAVAAGEQSMQGSVAQSPEGIIAA